MKNILRRLTNLIKKAVITKGADDTGNIPRQQLTYNGKTADSEIFFPYGMSANMASGNRTMCVLFAMEGQEDNRIAMGHTPTLRPRNLAEGELVVYHPLTQTKMHFRNNGDLDITTAGASGAVNLIAPGGVNVTAPLTTITGDLTVTGDTALGAVVTSNGTDISETHTHGGSATAPGGPVSPTGVPV